MNQTNYLLGIVLLPLLFPVPAAGVDPVTNNPLMENTIEFVHELGMTFENSTNRLDWSPGNAAGTETLSFGFSELAEDSPDNWHMTVTNAVSSSSVNAELRQYESIDLALACTAFLVGGGSSLPPDVAAQNTTVRTNAVGIVEFARNMAFSDDGHRWLLFKNIAIELRECGNEDAFVIAERILELGGVNTSLDGQ